MRLDIAAVSFGDRQVDEKLPWCIGHRSGHLLDGFNVNKQRRGSWWIKMSAVKQEPLYSWWAQYEEGTAKVKHHHRHGHGEVTNRSGGHRRNDAHRRRNLSHIEHPVLVDDGTLYQAKAKVA